MSVFFGRFFVCGLHPQTKKRPLLSGFDRASGHCDLS